MNIFLFHRDLRLVDNTSLIKQLSQFKKVVPIFIFPPEQIDPKKNKYFSHHSVQFMIESLEELDEDIREHKEGKLYFFKGDNIDVLKQIHQKQKIASIGFNLDYTPYAKKRDQSIIKWAKNNKIQVVSEEDYALYKVLDDTLINPNSNKPYLVFTPFKNYCLSHLQVRKPDNFNKFAFQQQVQLQKLNCSYPKQQLKTLFEKNQELAVHGGRKNGLKILQNIKNFSKYNDTRNYPKLPTTKLSAHNHFTTVSIREVYHTAYKVLGLSNNIINELHWRQFYYCIGNHFPKTLQGKSFQSKFDQIQWKYNQQHLQAWKKGQTGFPIVDAAMRQLNTIGWMHNRCRMIVASFFSKNLFLDWHEGQRYFASKLVDYSPMQNAGGWQWTVGNGTDAAPYFRIFNAWTQQKNYDSQCTYIKKWIPQLKNVPNQDIHKWQKCHQQHLKKGIKYFAPIISHDETRKQTLETYKHYFNS